MRNYEKTNGRLEPIEIEDIIQNVVSNNKLEGLHATDEETSLLRDYAYGIITGKEYDAAALRLAGVTL